MAPETVTSLLQRFRQGLMAVITLGLVLALCPCLVSAQPAEDDCCDSSGPAMSGMCCDEGAGSPDALTASTFLLAAADTGPVQPLSMAPPASFPVPFHPLAPGRPMVARAVLRI